MGLKSSFESKTALTDKFFRSLVDNIQLIIDNIDVIQAVDGALLDSLKRIYGDLSSEPTTRVDGSPIQNGDVYYNTTDSTLYIHTNSTWGRYDLIGITQEVIDSISASEAAAEQAYLDTSALLTSINALASQVSTDKAAVSTDRLSVEASATQVGTDATAVSTAKTAVEANLVSVIAALDTITAAQANVQSLEESASNSASLAQSMATQVATDKATVEAARTSVAADKVSVEAAELTVSADRAEVETLTLQVTADAAQVAADAIQVASDKASAEAAASQVQTTSVNVDATKTVIDDLYTDMQGIQVDSAAHESMAAEWAEHAVDIEITGYPGSYSALHHAQKAADEHAQVVTLSAQVTSDATTVSAAKSEVQAHAAQITLDAATVASDRIAVEGDAATVAADKAAVNADRVAVDSAAQAVANDRTAVETFALNAASSATAASDHANNAAASESTVMLLAQQVSDDTDQVVLDAAQVASDRTAVETAQSTIASYVTDSETARDQAVTAKTAAEQARDEAQQAAAGLTNGMAMAGDWDASPGNLPPSPPEGSVIYRIAVAGTLGGTYYKTDDLLVYNPVSLGWFRVGSSDADIYLEDILDAGSAASASITDFEPSGSLNSHEADPDPHPQYEQRANLGTAATKNTPVTGNASATEVVLGNDSRLSDARAPTTHNHDDVYYTESEVNSLLTGKVDNSRVLTDVPAGAVFTDTLYDDTALQDQIAGKANSTHNHVLSQIIDAGTAAASDVTDFATAAQGGKADTALQAGDVGTAASRDVAETGNASAAQVVLGNDSRLSDARAPTAHTHDDLYYTEAETNALLNGKVNNERVLTDVPASAVFTDTVYDDTAIQASISSLQTDVAGKASTGHVHVLSDVSDAGTAASKNVAETGDASATEVVLGNDSRLSDARNPTAHTHDDRYYTEAEVNSLLAGKVDDAQVQTNVPVGAVFTDTVYDDTSLQAEVAGKAASVHTHSLNQVTDAGSAASRDVPGTGDALSTQVVLGNDSRLTDPRVPTTHAHDDLYYTEGEVDALLASKVNTTQVLTDVPAGAVFTDTIFDDSAIWAELTALGESSGGAGFEYVFKVANATVTASQYVIADTTAGAFTITLPASPGAGDTVILACDKTSWATNNLTVDRNGETIDGVAQNATLSDNNIQVKYVYDGTTWRGFVGYLSTFAAPQQPLLQGPSSSLEDEVVTFQIVNYNPYLVYYPSVSTGSVQQVANLLHWTLPIVTADTNATITVEVTEVGIGTTIVNESLLIINIVIPTTGDDAVIIDSAGFGTFSSNTGWTV
ncbi:hypothetical protein [Marinobacterium litorale]|uniref:hypothetical protein n=1 Tax=Marinobacterium litorale TaxID=404770 RepID=UPI0004138423|nr:hypothetical protein [Marinobacterium litorale]